MAINLPDLPNGLKQINTGITPGDGQGDTLRNFAEKVNLNTQLTLSENDDIGGPGLSWNPSTRKLSFAGLPRQIVVANSYIPLGPEFDVVGGSLRLQSLDASRLTGTLRADNLLLSDRQVPVGFGGTGKAYSLSTEFQLLGEQLSIGSIPWSKISNVAVIAAQISLPSSASVVAPATIQNSPGTIALGQSTQTTAVALSSDFTVSNNILSLVASNELVTLGSINASGAQVGRVLAIKGPASAMSLEWVNQTTGGGGLGSISVNDILTTNKPSPLALVQVSPSGNDLEWVPDLRNRIEAAGRAYANFLADQQRRVNLDYARSIAEVQNRTCEVFNYKMPGVYTSSIGLPQQVTALPGAIYIAGGHGLTGYSRSIQRFDIQNETLKVISAIPGPDFIAGEVYTGLVRTKAYATSVASSANMYVAGIGAVTPGGTTAGTWNLDKFNFTKQSSILLNLAALTSLAPSGGAAFGDSTKGYFVGGVQGSSHINSNSGAELLYVTETANALSIALSSTTTYSSTSEVFYSTGSQVSIGYIFGGVNNTTVISSVRSIALNATSVSTVGSLNLGGNSFAAASFKDESSAYLFGGSSSTAPIIGTNTALRFNSTNSTLTALSLGLAIFDSKRSSMTGAAGAKKGYLFGGTMSVAKSRVVQTYTENVAVWSERTIPQIRTVQNVAGQTPLYRYNG